MSWGILKKLNSNLKIPLNEQLRVPFTDVKCEWFEQDCTFVVPQDGWYIITCVGKGGNGCGSKSVDSGVNGGGGGGGALVKGRYYLKKGETHEITVGDPSAFGDLLSAGAGEDGGEDTGGAGGACLIKGNIANYTGKAGSADGTGGACGYTSLWSIVQSGAGKGYLPFPNKSMLGGTRGTADSEPGTPLFGGGEGGAYPAYYNGTVGEVTTAAGAGGAPYGGGGEGGNGANPAGYKDSVRFLSNPGKGASGIVFVEYSILLPDLGG